ncbi:IS4-like element ISBlma3 family transposase [Blastopirellula marina]|nr:IS4-like element ISBlma3 family transposase [Blastopirellula marina]
MAKKRKLPTEFSAHGAAMLRQVFPLLAKLSASGTERDKAGNRRLLFSQYASLILVGLFNPALESARAIVAASGVKKIAKLTGGKKVADGSFSEASSIFDPRLLEGIIKDLRSRWHQQRMSSEPRSGRASDRTVERLIAVDGSVLTALPQIVGRIAAKEKGQWRFHALVHVLDGQPVASKLTEEPSAKGRAERDVLAEMIAADQIDIPQSDEGHLFLMDRGYRSAELFNKIHTAGHDYICRLNRTDGKLLKPPKKGEVREPIQLPPLSAEAIAMGIVADELITMGGNCGASKIGSDHPMRRIKLIPPADRPSSARQGRVRTDQTGRDELVLATTLMDLTAEEIVRLYEHRWEVELFFRFLKQVLGCKKLLSAKTAGVQIQLYCAIIASLLLALTTGGDLTRRKFEMICLYFAGWADEEELLEAMEKRPP